MWYMNSISIKLFKNVAREVLTLLQITSSLLERLLWVLCEDPLMSVSSGFPWLLPLSLQSEILPGSVVHKRRSRRAYTLHLQQPQYCVSYSASLSTSRLRHGCLPTEGNPDE